MTTKNMGGWITINRSIIKHWVWTDAIYFKLWIEFLLRANYETNKVFIGSRLIILQRGQFITSVKKLALEYNCSRNKIKRFLILLQDDSMIKFKTDTKFTQITICNYSFYQDIKQKKGNQVDIKKSSSEHQKSTENHLNKKNNNKNETNRKRIEKGSSKELYDVDGAKYQLALLLYNLIKSHNPNLIFPDLQSWTKEIDIMITKDKRNDEDIGEAIFFSQESEFWKNTVTNPKKLRQNFETILKQMSE